MALVDFALASPAHPADDADLRRLLRANPLPGEISLSYEREPSFWAAPALEGTFHQTMIVRAQDGRAVGMGTRTVRDLYVNGVPMPVGYMSQLRVDPTFAWGIALPKVLAQGWRCFRHWHADGRTPFYLVSLVRGSKAAKQPVAWRMMTLGLPDWPVLHPVGGLLTFAIHVRRTRALPRLQQGLTLRRACADDRAAIAACLARNGQRRHFTPVWPSAALGDPELTPGLSMANFWIVARGEQVVGTLARWDQQRFKQSVVRGYDARLRAVRPLVNALAWLGLAPRLPAVGEAIRHSFASHLAIDDDDPQVSAALLAATYNDAVAAGDDYLMLGLDANHPFCAGVRAYRHVVYATQLCLATWGEDVAKAQAISGGQMGAEVALL